MGHCWLRGWLLGTTLLAQAVASTAAEVHVAVASNFAAPAREIAEAFNEASGHRAILSFGSTGKLYTQIRNGAPFAVLLAADAERPARLVEEGPGLRNTRFTYALGRLVLYSADPRRVRDSPTVLAQPGIRRVAIANPDTAPYGAAAVEALKQLGAWESTEPKLVRGENVGQAWQFVATGNAQLGIVALAQIKPELGGSWWLVPEALHQPIRQQAVLLQPSEAGRAFLRFLREPEVRKIIRSYGYATE